MKQLTEWITQPMSEPQHRTIGHKSLTVLVNVCYGNLPAIYTLMRTVDTKEFVGHLISLKVSVVNHFKLFSFILGDI